MSGTASDIMPVLVNSTQQLIVSLNEMMIFDDISALEILIGLFALSILSDFIYWLRTRGGGEGNNV